MNYKKKYLKYKIKYLTTKKIYGGMNSSDYIKEMPEIMEQVILDEQVISDEQVILDEQVISDEQIILDEQDDIQKKLKDEAKRILVENSEIQERLECNRFTVCQKFAGNCGLVSVINLFIKIKSINNKLLSDFKQYFEDFKKCPTAGPKSCMIHPKHDDTRKVYLKYLKFFNPSYFVGDVVKNKILDPFNYIDFEGTNNMIYFISICELNKAFCQLPCLIPETSISSIFEF